MDERNYLAARTLARVIRLPRHTVRQRQHRALIGLLSAADADWREAVRREGGVYAAVGLLPAFVDNRQRYG